MQQGCDFLPKYVRVLVDRRIKNLTKKILQSRFHSNGSRYVVVLYIDNDLVVYSKFGSIFDR